MPIRHLGTPVALLALLLPVAAPAKVGPSEEALYGGVYSAQCNEPSALRARLFGDTMRLEQGAKVVAARDFKSSKTAPSSPPPPAFRIAYVGEVAGGDGLVFVLTHDASGLFVTLAGGPKTLAMIGPGLQGQRLRHCDPNRNALPGASAPQWVAPDDLLRDPKFKRAYLKALGPLSSEKWLATLSGPAPEVRSLSVGGRPMRLAAVCKPRDCGDNNLVLLYDPASTAVYGQVYQAGRSTLLGNPPAALRNELDTLWRQEWRSGR